MWIRDSGYPTISLDEYMMGKMRFKTLIRSNPEAGKRLLKLAEAENAWRLSLYKQIAAMQCVIQKEEKKVPAQVN